MPQALNGIIVLDLTRVLAGPFATMVMGDMGADVIKIEMPKTGDDARHFPPHVAEESAYFMSLNRNKRSITLNLKEEKAREIFRELVKKADVVVENFRPGTMEKLGLGYCELKLINPRIIYAAASGFGHTGPYSKRAAYDGVAQAMGGIMSITGYKGGKPTRVGPSIGDITAGLYTTIGILAALNYRRDSGVGQKVDVAMLDCQLAILENALARYVVTGIVPEPAGNRHTSVSPFETFETIDGEILIAAGNDALWVKLCELFQKEEWLQDERFKTNALRTKHIDELAPMITEITKTKTTEEWQVLLDIAGVPNGPINTIDKVICDPQVIARNMIVEIEHPTAGNLKMAGVPIKMSETQGEIKTPSPLLGQHTDEILKEILGMSEDEIKKLGSENIF